MADYTPATHEIRAGAVYGRAEVVLRREKNVSPAGAERIAEAEFDRWLATINQADRVAELEAKVARVEAALANHPRCEKHPDDDIVTCGWKSAVIDVQAALAGESDE